MLTFGRHVETSRGSRKERITSSRNLGAVAAGMVFLVLIAAVAASGRTERAGTLVQIRVSPVSGFTPSTLTVRRGAIVTWVNDDKQPHTVTSMEGAFASQAISTAGSFFFRFDTPGAYSYFSGFQPQMTGKIVVR